MPTRGHIFGRADSTPRRRTFLICRTISLNMSSESYKPQIRKAEIRRSRRKRPQNLDAYDLYLRALPHVYAMHPDDNSRALEFLIQAIELDPEFAPAPVA